MDVLRDARPLAFERLLLFEHADQALMPDVRPP